MSNPSTSSKVPHSLRIVILFLRLALGLSFFYLGFTELFDRALVRQLDGHSLPELYSWIAGTPSLDWIHVFAPWAFMIIGACLVLGLATRLAAIVAIVLTLLSYLPSISYTAITVQQFINDEVIIVICLLVLIFSNAGTYLGLDKFLHISFKHKEG
jgi:uncharacterized membrane protein YphA (DoxX/SURF4 family)